VKLVLLAAATLFAGSVVSVPHWPAPPNPIPLMEKAGFKPQYAETLNYHVHSHLDVFVDGRHVTVPAGIGININDPGVQRGRLQDGSWAYGGIQRCANPCISPLHTHDDTGIIHTEAQTHRTNLLGELFTEWNVRLTVDCVATFCKPKTSVKVYVNGKLDTHNPRFVKLANQREIAIVIGKPPKHIPSEFFLG
jgi:hypothetical protein